MRTTRTAPSARKIENSAGAGRASWTEVSDSYVKARFTCGCGEEIRLPVGEMIQTGPPLLCKACGKTELAYTGLFAFL